jgi:hypothetical protein
MPTLTRQEKALAATPRRGDVLPGGLRAAARRLGIAPRKAYRLAEKGEYPFALFCYRAGSIWVVPSRAFARFLNGEFTQNTNAPAAEARARAAR